MSSASLSLSITSPYVNTVLVSYVVLMPNQLDNNLYLYLKSNLVAKHEGKCFKNFGYVSKIFEILDVSDGFIPAENPNSEVKFRVKFSCHLCHPLRKKVIICKVHKMSSQLINVTNGPINAMIVSRNINKDKFFIDSRNGKIMIRGPDNKATELLAGRHVKIRIIQTMFMNDEQIIKVFGELLDVATDKEIKESIEDEYAGIDKKLIEYEKYISDENDRNNVTTIGDSKNVQNTESDEDN